MNFDHSRVPREIHQKETIVMHIPKINRPLTYRQLYFIVPGILISLLIQLLGAVIIKLPSNGLDKFVDIVIRLFVFLAVPILAGVCSTFKRKGKYLEELLFRRVSYSRKSRVVLNEKALRAYKNK